PTMETVKASEYLERAKDVKTLSTLWAGSWIHSSFAIWIGHSEDNMAWDLLYRTREFLVNILAAHPELKDNPAAQQAWEEIYIAEGSDWCWWYGDDHSSAQDALFDYLFRKHLQNVYLLLDDTPPPDLLHPISRRGQLAIHSLPRAFLQVKIDGPHTF